jgi:hypothetical protein
MVLVTLTLLTVTALLTFTVVAPTTKFVPIKVTGTVVPWTPLLGLMEVTVGGGGVTVNVAALLVPPGVVTVTLAASRVAVAAMVKVAVI